MCLSGLWAPAAETADAAPVVSLVELPAASLPEEVLLLTQQEVGAVVLRVLLRTPSAHVLPIFFWTQAPHDATVVRHRDGATAGPAGLGQGVRVLQAGAAVTPSRVLRAGHFPLPWASSSYSTDAATPGFVEELRAPLFATNTDNTTNSTHSPGQMRLLMVRMIGAVGAPCTGGAAPIPHVPHQEPCARHQQQTILAVYGVTATSHPYATSDSTSSHTTSSYNPLLLIQEQAELLKLQVLPDHLFLPHLQFLELLEVEGHLFAHDAGTVTAKPLPLSGHTLTLLTVIV